MTPTGPSASGSPYRLLSGPTLEGYPDAEDDCLDIAPINDAKGHIMFVDDNRLLGDMQAYFAMGKQGAIFGGWGVIAHKNGGDNEVVATTSVDDIGLGVAWRPSGTDFDIGLPAIEVICKVNQLKKS
jgi:hypothetical protein